MVRRTRLRTAADFLRWEPIMAESQRSACASVPRPAKVLGIPVPSTIDGLTFEQLAQLWSIRNADDLLTVGAMVVLGVEDKRKVLRSDIIPAVGFANWLASELQRVTQLWNDIPATHTPEEIAAGCNSLRFGVFGIADWYARRMGITDHDDAMRTPWVRVYQCMRNDAEVARYERRLNEIITSKHK